MVKLFQIYMYVVQLKINKCPNVELAGKLIRKMGDINCNGLK